VLAAAIYVSSSAITVKGLIDFRRLADDETDLVLAILVAEDLAIALVLGFVAAGGGAATDTLVLVAEAIAFVAAALAVSKWLARPLDRVLDWLPRSSSCWRCSRSCSAPRRLHSGSAFPRRSAR
jgi:CPA2 family monovalent cation:H+ antiporter-2